MKPPPDYWPRISSALFYQDAPAAIDWLCRAFGFEVKIKIDGPPGSVIHSELLYGGGLIMVSGPPKDPAHASPHALGGKNTQSLMIYVDDAKAHCERARTAGAKILKEPEVVDYGKEHWADLGYSAEDPEGHQWYFAERVRSG
jgi:uncharacterized glyoxalase superfamily protein PhnB